MKDLEPITREETMLAKVAGQDVPTFEPVTREEFFLAKAAGQDVPELEPVTRKEYFLADVIEAIESGGGGSDLGTKTISANGVYKASDDSLDGYSKVTVNVPASAVDSGTKTISENGSHDVTGYASASVSVPNSYSAEDEGKVVSNGALVAQSSDTVTENDTYDTTTISSLTVNVSGGGANREVEILSGTLSGAYTNSTVTKLKDTALAWCHELNSVNLSAVTSSAQSAFRGDTNLESISMPNLQTSGNYMFYGCSKLNNVSLPNLTAVASNMFENCTSLTSIILPVATKVNDSGLKNCRFTALVLPNVTELNTYSVSNNPSATAVDLPKVTNLKGGSGFINNTNMNTLVIRNASTVPPMGNINYFNGTPFASGGAGGTLYVPSSMISSYQSATNWSTILGYANNSIVAIEGSQYENYYVDGTPVSN